MMSHNKETTPPAVSNDNNKESAPKNNLNIELESIVFSLLTKIEAISATIKQIKLGNNNEKPKQLRSLNQVLMFLIVSLTLLISLTNVSANTDQSALALDMTPTPITTNTEPTPAPLIEVPIETPVPVQTPAPIIQEQSNVPKADNTPIPVETDNSTEINQQIINVTIKNQAKIQVIIDKGLDVWHIDYKNDIYIATILTSKAQQNWLTGQGFKFEIDEERTQELLSNINQIKEEAKANNQEKSQEENTTFFGGYHTVEGSEALLQSLNQAHPDIAELFVIGHSLEGRPIYAIQITDESDSTPKPAFVMNGAIHARELAAGEIPLEFAQYLIEQYGSNPDITALVNNTKILIIPILNVDGRKMAEQGYLWRKNTRNVKNCPIEGWRLSNGVDNNRNFPTFDWGTNGVSDNECYQTWPGTRPNSEPETQALVNLTQGLWPIIGGNPFTEAAPVGTQGVFIDVHAYGKFFSIPWGNGQQIANFNALKTMIDRFAEMSGYDSKFPSVYKTSGTTKDYIYESYRASSFLVELGNDFFQPYVELNGIWQNTLPAFLYATHLTGNPYIWYQGPEIVNGEVGGLVNPTTTTEAFANFPGADQVYYYYDKLTNENKIGYAPQGTPITINGSTIPHGRHVIIAQGCKQNGICGPFYGIGFLESKPIIWVNDPANLSTLTGPANITFTGGGAHNDGITSTETQFCTSGSTIEQLKQMTAIRQAQTLSCGDWSYAEWNESTWQKDWTVPSPDDEAKALILNVRLNTLLTGQFSPYTKTLMYGLNKDLYKAYLPIIYR